MAAEEDILLREVDDDLKQDQTIEFFKKYGSFLIGAAVMVVIAVGGLQFYRGAEARAEAKSAEIYADAIAKSNETPAEGAAIMLTAAEGTRGGYTGLSRLRAAAFQAQDDDMEGAIATLVSVAEDGSQPNRLRDLARLRAGHIVIDQDPARAKALAGAVVSEPMQPLAQELTALADLAAGDYEAAYAGFSRLAELDLALSLPGVSQRAQLMAPVADAARRGVPLEAQASEAEDFIKSFSEQLSQELGAPAEGAEEEDIPDDGDNH